MHPTLRIENVSKKFGLRESFTPPDTLRDSAWNILTSPFRRRNRTPSKKEIWALRNITFDVSPGDLFGLIGNNGSGKTTLFRILGRITEPSAGRAILRGRTGTLVEASAGFHPELTGRENIFLAGAIQGASRAEIRQTMESIVEFAEVASHLDTPVKRYSSGMLVRLAFSVACHLAPEILLFDEVLAVGDAAFQEKAVERMNQLVRDGRTVLFVSHDLQTIARVCRRVLVLHQGEMAFLGDPLEAVAFYKKRAVAT